LPIVVPSTCTDNPVGFELIEYVLSTAGLADGNAYGTAPPLGFPPPPPPLELLPPPPPHDAAATVRHEKTPANQTLRIDLPIIQSRRTKFILTLTR
jgi:hypothetical protein